MMIAARLAGGNLFFCLFCSEGGLLGAARSTRIFLRGFVVGGFFFLGGGVCFGL